jgi:hypothetical protein
MDICDTAAPITDGDLLKAGFVTGVTRCGLPRLTMMGDRSSVQAKER